jgi:hypothetical protein
MEGRSLEENQQKETEQRPSKVSKRQFAGAEQLYAVGQTCVAPPPTREVSCELSCWRVSRLRVNFLSCFFIVLSLGKPF